MSERTRAESGRTSAWPRRLAVATLLAAVPLVFFGGGVTTLDAGLAVEGWLVLDPGRGDYFLWLYPVDQWFRNLGTFVEHTHRLLGSLVGLLAIATVLATWRLDRRTLPRALSLSALLAVVVQGTLGGLRVLERSDGLAFLHGAIGQAVFALLGATCVAARRDFARAEAPSADDAFGRRLKGRALAAVAAVYLQIGAGAWLRHGGGTRALALHGVLAVAVLVCIAVLVAELSNGARMLAGEPRRRVLSLRRSLVGSLSVQMALGVAALLVVPLAPAEAAIGAAIGTAVIPTLHVVGGAALLLACVVCAMWAHQLFPARARLQERLVADLEPGPVLPDRELEPAR